MRLVPTLLLGLILMVASSLRAQLPSEMSGGRMAGLAGAYAAVHGDLWSLMANPSGLADIEGISFGVGVERRFSLSQLNYGSGGIAMPFAGTQAAGLAFFGYGFGQYQEFGASLTYGIEVLERLRLGARLQYSGLNIPENGSTSSLWVDAGLQFDITQEFTLGFFATNVNRASLNLPSGREDLPATFRLGLTYAPADKVLLSGELRKDLEFPLSGRLGIEYALHPVLRIRAGIDSAPVTGYFGLGLLWQGLMVDFAASVHPQLGFTPVLSVGYNLGSSE